MALLPLENLKSPWGLVRFFGVAVVGLFFDLWTKYLAVKHLKDDHTIVRFIPGWLHFEYLENFGAAMGLGQGQRVLFLVVSIAAIFFLSFLYLTSQNKRVMQFVLGMLLAGVIGNLYDRAVYGYVRDMIHALPGKTWPFSFWPFQEKPIFPWVFNVADSFLCVGVGAMILLSFLYPEKKPDAVVER